MDPRRAGVSWRKPSRGVQYPGMKRLTALVVAVVALSACQLNSQGPWLDANGNMMSGNDMVEFYGFAACDQQQVVFIQFFGDQYAKDLRDDLGELTSPVTGEPIDFELLESLPEGAEGTGITHAGREIYVGEDRAEYIYVRLPNGQAERWPRAEDTCQRGDPDAAWSLSPTAV